MWEGISTETVKKARKDHRCVWCPEVIVKGSPCVRQVGIFEGDFQFSRYHPECWEAAGRYFNEGEAECFEPHSFKRGTTQEADGFPPR